MRRLLFALLSLVAATACDGAFGCGCATTQPPYFQLPSDGGFVLVYDAGVPANSQGF